jgi:transcription elongation GreA/GreB family factor
MDATYVTAAGLSLLQRRIADLEGQLARIREEKAVAYTASGDCWHDNPGFNALEQQEDRLARELRGLRTTAAAAVLVVVDETQLSTVQIGSVVRCRRCREADDTEDEVTLEIVGFGEGDPLTGRIAYDTPVARALLGLARGQSREVRTPRGLVEYTVLGLATSRTEVGA